MNTDNEKLKAMVMRCCIKKKPPYTPEELRTLINSHKS